MADLIDVKERLIRHLRREKLLSAIDPEHIIVAENLSAADVVLFSRRGILAAPPTMAVPPRTCRSWRGRWACPPW
ncbi:hypothetical protein [Rhodothermus marinus]|uniref:hypothetical protein n=1 Tax=Rhodothermus marinus TaxID=29549 RepID=UPI000AF1A263|nr:hypothetical protein [Rhodothermus marinus]